MKRKTIILVLLLVCSYGFSQSYGEYWNNRTIPEKVALVDGMYQGFYYSSIVIQNETEKKAKQGDTNAPVIEELKLLGRFLDVYLLVGEVSGKFEEFVTKYIDSFYAKDSNKNQLLAVAYMLAVEEWKK